MKDTATFNGIFPAVVTPFKANLDIDFEAFEVLIDRLFKANVHGIFVGGNMGEWYTQTLDERKDIANRAVICSQGRGKVFLHVGSARIEDAIALARYGEKIGVDALASLPPYYARFRERDILGYYDKLARSTRLSVLIYYHPVLTGFQLTQAAAEKIFSLPNVTGMKFTDYDLLTLTSMIEFQDRRLHVLNGHDQVLFSSLLLGAAGGIGSFYNIIPDAFVDLYGFVKKGNIDEARSLQQQINKFIMMAKAYALIPALKHILHVAGCGTGAFRTSIEPLTRQEKMQLEHDLKESTFFSKPGSGN